MPSSAKNTSLSVEFRLWQFQAQAGWVVSVTGVDMTAAAGTKTYTSSEATQPWCFISADGTALTRNRIKVYVNGALVVPSTYSINFKGASVTFNSPPGGAVTADIDYFAAHVVENFEEQEDQVVEEILKELDLPIIAYGLTGWGETPFAVGSTVADRSYPLTIDALCQDDGQKKDLGDDLSRYIKVIPLLDFSEGWVLTSAGDANTSLDLAAIRIGQLRVLDVRAAWPNPRRGGSDKEKHRVLVTASVKNVV